MLKQSLNHWQLIDGTEAHGCFGRCLCNFHPLDTPKRNQCWPLHMMYPEHDALDLFLLVQEGPAISCEH